MSVRCRFIPQTSPETWAMLISPMPLHSEIPPPTPTESVRRIWMRWGWPPALGALIGIAIRLVFSGHAGGPYNAMMGAFALLVPMVIGAVTVVTAEQAGRRSWAFYFWAAASANALCVFFALLMTIEGLICAILAVPLFGILGGIAGLITGYCCRRASWPRRA